MQRKYSLYNEIVLITHLMIHLLLIISPGSKSLQSLDMLYTSSKQNLPSGLLVVNDSDRNRIVTLCQRTRHVPRAPMLAINMDARYFPGMRRSHIIKQKAGYKQKYDKVLCDAPCSGDGTTRKSKPVWNTWSMGHAMSLHRLQRRILRRGTGTVETWWYYCVQYM